MPSTLKSLTASSTLHYRLANLSSGDTLHLKLQCSMGSRRNMKQPTQSSSTNEKTLLLNKEAEPTVEDFRLHANSWVAVQLFSTRTINRDVDGR
eukprot:scaffold9528_cov18-Prasinocladus_malaysianus.AAC.1